MSRSKHAVTWTFYVYNEKHLVCNGRQHSENTYNTQKVQMWTGENNIPQNCLWQAANRQRDMNSVTEVITAIIITMFYSASPTNSSNRLTSVQRLDIGLLKCLKVLLSIQQVPRSLSKYSSGPRRIREPFRTYGWGLSESDLKRIVCQHSRVVETAQSVGFNLSVPNTAYYIPNGRPAPASQWAPDWTERKSQGMVTRLVSTFPLF